MMAVSHPAPLQLFRHKGDIREHELRITSDSSFRRGRLLGAV